MPAAPAILAATTAAATLAGAGLSFYGQQQAAATAQRMGDYNYAVQKSQMEMQARIAQAEAQAQANIAGYNAAAAQSEAVRAEQEARERAKRIRQDNERLLSAQRARFGSSGVTSEGTPLAVMADTATIGEVAAADAIYEGDAKRMGFLREAAIQRYSQGISLLNANTQGWNAANAGAFAMPYKLQGQAEASGFRMGSYGSLIGGVAQAGSGLLRMW